MKYRWMIAAAVVLGLGACKTTSSAATSGPAPSTTQAGAESDAPTAATTPLRAPPREGAPAVTRLEFDRNTLRVSRDDGSFAERSSGGFEFSEPLRENRDVLAWSTDGRLAIVDGEPPVIVRRSDGREVLRFVKVEAVETAGFFADGSGLYIGEPSGQLHVWNESVDTLEAVPTQDLESFIARQSPSFSAGFPPLSGAATVTSRNQFLVGTEAGKLMWWHPDSPTNVQTLVKLPGPIADTAYAGGKVYATTEDGQFRAAKTSNRVFLEWSASVDADFVAAASDAPTRVLVANASAVTMLDANDGSKIWSRPIQQGSQLCGLGLSADGQTGALCIDGGVVLLDADGQVIDTLPKK